MDAGSTPAKQHRQAFTCGGLVGVDGAVDAPAARRGAAHANWTLCPKGLTVLLVQASPLDRTRCGGYACLLVRWGSAEGLDTLLGVRKDEPQQLNDWS